MVTSSFPNYFESQLSKLVHDFAKFEKTFFASRQPTGGTQCATRKSIAAVRGMPKRNGVLRGIEADLVRTRNRAGAAFPQAQPARMARARTFPAQSHKPPDNHLFLC